MLGSRFPQVSIQVINYLFVVIFGGLSSGAIFNSGVLDAIMAMLGIVILGETTLVGFFNMLYKQFASIAIATFFLPALMIIILGAVVRSLSASIGTETDITGILRAV